MSVMVKTTESGQMKPRLVPLNLQHEIEQFYYWEARLLDGRRYEEWFSLLAQDIHYFMPIRTTLIMREAGNEFVDSRSFAHFADDHQKMNGRIRKIKLYIGWFEKPA